MSQSFLKRYGGGTNPARPANFENLVRSLLDSVDDVSDDVGVQQEFFGAQANALDSSTGVLRWQYSTTYEYFTRDSAKDTKVGTIQFRTHIYTLEPPSDTLKGYLKDINHRRLHTLFDTNGPYSGYIEGFGLISDDDNVEGPKVVGQDEIPPTGLGVPNFSVEIYDSVDLSQDNIVGHAKGYSMDFGAIDDADQTPEPPEQEVWRIFSWNKARGDYELGPKGDTPARERAVAAAGKVAYINGFPVGQVTSRGTTWLTKEHTRPAAATYRSRQYITEHSGTPYQALQKGVKLYKVAEDENGVYLSTTQPKGFSPVSDADVDPGATGIITPRQVLGIDPDEPTVFVVTADIQDDWALGKYNSPVTAEIDRETYFTIHTGWQ